MDSVPARVSATPVVCANRSILVVDDEESICELLYDILTDEGYQVAIATNGFEALDYLQAHPAPCLILLDLMMPLMDGRQFRAAQRVDPTLNTIPVVVMTAGLSRERLEALIEADDYMLTPFGIDALLALVERYCGAAV